MPRHGVYESCFTIAGRVGIDNPGGGTLRVLSRAKFPAIAKVARMFGPIDTRDTASVLRQVEAIYSAMFPAGDKGFVARAFGWAEQCFAGQSDDYQPIDARYHDFEHTMQGTLCLARLIHGRHRTSVAPVLSPRIFELGLMAILFHDMGYLKKKGDSHGSGAKYTAIHVSRSIAFAAEFLSGRGFSPSEIMAIQNMIRCTGINANVATIPFQSEPERVMGYALGTADLLGQMADSDYVEKLPVLYQEFAEASGFDPAHSEGLRQFSSADDLVRKTPAFWENYVWPRLNSEFGRLYAFLNDPYPDGPNPYVKSVEENIRRISFGKAANA
jgi:hypothetical protein